MTNESVSGIATAVIVGGGIGGMAAAISLATRGVAVNLIKLAAARIWMKFMSR